MKAKLRKTYNILIRMLIAFFTVVFLYDQLFYRKDLMSVFDVFFELSTGFLANMFLVMAVLLFPVNIILESIKWKYLIDKLEKITLVRSIKGVFAGISVSMIMPNRVGDYLGRVFMLKKANRIQAVLSTILGSLAQFFTTILFGLIAIVFYYPEFYLIDTRLSLWLYVGFIILIASVVCLMILAFLNFSVFSILLKKISGRYYKKIKKYAKVFSLYKQRELLNVLLLSIIRYGVFSLQFFLLLSLFEVNVNYFEAMMLISIIYLVMTIIPTIALTEIGVRGSVSLYVFQNHLEILGLWNTEQAIGVVSASSLLWLINLVFPAIIGTGFVFNLKFFRKINGN